MLTKEAGARLWLVPDCYWPEITTEGHYVSHESICVLNIGRETAHLTFTLYFEDRPPMKGFFAQCGGERTHHVRMDRLLDEKSARVPMGVPYAALVESDMPVVVQYSRLDTTQPNMTLTTTIAHPIA